MSASGPKSGGVRLSGIDSIRFIAAFFVVCAHMRGDGFGLPDPSGMHGVAKYLCAAVRNIFVGPPAVQVFFIISGFCIHLPYAGASEMDTLGRYYIRRFVRILPPMLAAMVLCRAVSLPVQELVGGIFWSLFAELIYYTLYPALRKVAAVTGWGRLWGGSCLLALAIVLTAPGNEYLPGYGVWLTWAVGLPAWLLGCVVAERVKTNRIPEPSPRRLWLMRMAMLATFSFCATLRFHSSVGYPWSLNIMAPFFAYWFACEVAWHRTRPAWRWLEWLGAMSYSIYLVHMHAIVLLGRWNYPAAGGVVGWYLSMLFAITVGAVFYYVLEKPFHHLARRLAGPGRAK